MKWNDTILLEIYKKNLGCTLTFQNFSPLVTQSYTLTHTLLHIQEIFSKLQCFSSKVYIIKIVLLWIIIDDERCSVLEKWQYSYN